LQAYRKATQQAAAINCCVAARKMSIFITKIAIFLRHPERRAAGRAAARKFSKVEFKK